MSTFDERSSETPLLPHTRSIDPADRVASWRLGTTNRRPRRWINRFSLSVSGIAILTALTAVLTWATTAIGPPPHVAVTLAGTDYRANLDLPPNAMGDRAIGRLAAWASGTRTQMRTNIQLVKPPIELATKADFDQIDTNREAAVSLIYLSAHGIHTARGAGLLPADAGSEADTFLVADLLNRIATFPENQKKILVLDCVHFQSEPGLGILLNDFTRQVRQLDAQIQAIPNLVVILSADTHQQSWINPASGTTAWAQTFINAMNGAAEDLDQDGWIDLLDVHRHAAQQTERWVRNACHQQQTAILLPEGDSAIQRGRNLPLFPASTASIDIPALIDPVNSDRLRDWWLLHEAFDSRQPHPCVWSPALWRRFERTLLRYEHFEQVGSQSAADRLSEQLDDLRISLQRPTRIESIARSRWRPPSSNGRFSRRRGT
ncbi:MAG: hypothetical protein R3C05_30075 [Pirellulaceae bacterium]